jgi:hypothetical protein
MLSIYYPAIAKMYHSKLLILVMSGKGGKTHMAGHGTHLWNDWKPVSSSLFGIHFASTFVSLFSLILIFLVLYLFLLFSLLSLSISRLYSYLTYFYAAIFNTVISLLFLAFKSQSSLLFSFRPCPVTSYPSNLWFIHFSFLFYLKKFFIHLFTCAYIVWAISSPCSLPPPSPSPPPSRPDRTCSALFSNFVDEKT